MQERAADQGDCLSSLAEIIASDPAYLQHIAQDAIRTDKKWAAD
jgi:hypothetical protein